MSSHHTSKSERPDLHEFFAADPLEALEYMVDEHGMAPIEAPDFDRVIDYLSTHYGPDRPNFPQQ